MYDVLRFAVDAVREALDAAAELAVARGMPAPAVALRDDEVVAAFESERRLRAPGLEGVSGFAELSRFVQTADGWIRLHGNYPHHRAALLRVLGERDPVGAARAWPALELEDAIIATGGCAAAVRTPAEWGATPGTVPAVALGVGSGRVALVAFGRRSARFGRGGRWWAGGVVLLGARG